ncbi:MAG: 2-oxoacid:ferredoxin oxidoreductase subunit beta [Candidatus Kerfeldbacteria bacterium]
MSIELNDTATPVKPDWCPGCGDYSILMGVKKALVKLGRPLEETVVVTGIGCSSKFNHYVNTYGFESIHGRALPVAQAVHLANHKLNVVAVGGDGDGYGIGMGHFAHAMRRNMNFTYIVHDNQIYGLTKGQYSPTTEVGMKSSSSPFGAIEEPVNPIKMALSSPGVSFIGRGFAGDIQHLQELIYKAMTHDGFALVDVLQPCVTFNKLNTFAFFKERVYNLNEDSSYSTSDKAEALKRAEEWDEKIPIGVFYEATDMPKYEDKMPAIAETPLVDHDITNIDIEPLFDEFG